VNEPIVQSMTSQLIVRFRERILAGTYAPGAALRQDILASEFGTSKIPVREALVQLQAEGLIDIFPNRGFQVRPLAASELDEIFSLRLQIEPSAVARGAKLATAADHAAARKALEQLNAALTAEQFSSSGQLNRRFHVLLAVPRLQPVAADILGRLHALAQRYVQAHLGPRGRVKRAMREHTALLKVWSMGDTKQARALIHSHIECTRDDLTRAGAARRAGNP
jgi:DNA-binding GntR family transcriptional regulator